MDLPYSRRIKLLALSVVIALGVVTQQQVAAQSPNSLRSDVLSAWTTEQGLPQNFVTSIQQTPDGFLWVGTNGGLARFDGLRFRTFLHDGPAALRHRINNLVVDGSGTLWIGTSAGLFTYHEGAFQPVVLNGGTPTTILEVVRSHTDSTVWVLTVDGVFHGDWRRLTLLKQPASVAKVTGFTVDFSNHLWFAYADDIVETDEHKILGSFSLPKANLLYSAPDGQVYAGDGHHLFRFDKTGFVEESKVGPDEFVNVLIDHHGWLWMASGGLQGISRFANGKLEIFDVRDGLQSNDARVLFEDRSGDLWIGTISGLQRLHHGVFTSYGERDGLPPGHIQYDSIFQDHKGTVWTGTLDSGVLSFDGQRWHNFGLQQGVRAGQIRGFADGERSPVIAISDYGLFTSDGNKYKPIAGIPPGYTTSPVRGSDGSLWFAVLHKPVYRLKDHKLLSYAAAEGLTDDVIWALLAGKDGTIWAGAKSGLFRFDGARWHRDYASEGAVDAIALARDGSLFLGTSNGLVHLVRGKSWLLTQEDGLPGDTIFSAAEDEHGNLWLGTSHGICRLSAAQIEALDKGGKPQVVPEVFTEDDGLRSRSVLPIGQVTNIRAQDGRIWFATASGPAVAEVNTVLPSAPVAFVDGVTVDDEHLAPGSLNVKPGRHRVVFDFTAPTFIAPEQTRFRYRLRGWNNEWVSAEDLRQASYEGLPPGSYTFEVQAQGRTGELGPVSSGMTIVLEPHFWETRTFLFLLIVCLGALVAEVTRRRTLRKAEALNLRFQERATERERIASHIHDTFIQDLTGTALQLELAGMQLSEDPEVAKNSLTTLSARMREMIARSRDIVSNLHSMAGSQHSLLDLLEHVEVEFRLSDVPVFVLQSDGVPQPLHPFLRDEIYSICREAVANAFRHAAATRIEVRVSSSPARVLVEIRDDGVGMNEQMQTHGRVGHFGLSGMQAHARRINAVLTVESTPGEGTRMVVETPLPATDRAWTKLWSSHGRE